jgi:hypothetical protein
MRGVGGRGERIGMSDGQPTFLQEQIARRLEAKRADLTPPLPEKISIEINNSCNHQCFFCPNPIMHRIRRVMDDPTVLRILEDARSNGIREVSFYSTGEPFLNKSLPVYVARAKQLGFSYVYLSSNGGKAVSGRYRAVLEAGLDSLKFSINAGDRDSYRIVHGVDEFDDVMANLAFVADWRRQHRPGMRLFVSFVETAIAKPTFPAFKQRVGQLVDEVIAYPFVVIGTPLQRRTGAGEERPFIGYEHVDRSDKLNNARLTLPCYQLWSYLNVTVEGLLSACCSDFNNDLIVGSLHGRTLLEAWHSLEFQELRRRHIARRVQGTLCESCIAQRQLPYEPMNPHLLAEVAAGARSTARGR